MELAVKKVLEEYFNAVTLKVNSLEEQWQELVVRVGVHSLMAIA